MPLCAECKTFDLQSFRADAIGRRGYAVHDLLRRDTDCDFCRLLQHLCAGSSEEDWVHLELRPENRKAAEACQGLRLTALRVGVGPRRVVPLPIQSMRNWQSHSSTNSTSLGTSSGITDTTELHVFADEGMSSLKFNDPRF